MSQTLLSPPVSQSFEGIPLTEGEEFFHDRKELGSIEREFGEWTLQFFVLALTFAATVSPSSSEPLVKSPLIVKGHKVELDKTLMLVDVPYPLWVDGVFLVAVKRDDEALEFFSFPE